MDREVEFEIQRLREEIEKLKKELTTKAHVGHHHQIDHVNWLWKKG